METFQSESFEDFLMKTYDHFDLQYPKFYKMDFLSQAGLVASEFLVGEIRKMDVLPEEIGLVLSNKSGSTDTDLRFHQSTKTMASPSLFVYTLPNIAAGEMSIRHCIKGESAFFVTPHFEPKLLVSYLEDLFRTTELKLCIAGWLEVVGESHNIFLYLASKDQLGISVEHTIENIRTIYQS